MGIFQLQYLQFDILLIVAEHLGLEAYVLRRVCKSFSNIELSPATCLAHKLLRTRPGMPSKFLSKSRQPLRLIERAPRKWCHKAHFEQRAWRVEWSEIVCIADRAPIHELINAFLLIPSHDSSSMRCTILQAVEDWDVAFRKLPHEQKMKLTYPSSPPNIMAKKRVFHVRRVIKWIIEDRLWMVCCGKDIYFNDRGAQVVDLMDDKETTRAVKRILEEVNVHNGNYSFFHTMYGWLNFTPFLLAAERHNLPLVKYLHEYYHPSITIDSVSQAGNNAYTLCNANLVRSKCSSEEISHSDVLWYLTHCGLKQSPNRDEYAAYST